MQTNLCSTIRDTAAGREADRILRSCVHCGFCNATCPTYQLLGDELDGPRGRIYLIKQMLEGAQISHRTRLHLDRCLTCRNCETTCPSGVQYGRLLDIGRSQIERQAQRPAAERLRRWLLRRALLGRRGFAAALRLGQLARPLLPATMRAQIPARVATGNRPMRRHARRMLLLEGCVQPVLAPQINAAAARVLDALGVEVLRTRVGDCCGAISQHLGATSEAREWMRRNVDAWWPHVEAGAEAIVTTASGCGVMVKEYAHLLKNDAAYAARAARVAALACDIGEVLEREDLSRIAARPGWRIAFHAPCSLQHGQRLPGLVERVLAGLGYQLLPIADSHLCCGSAGTYSILQPQIAGRLRADKLRALQAGAPELIATANIGCQTHLAARAEVPVVHWITLLDPDPPGRHP